MRNVAARVLTLTVLLDVVFGICFAFADHVSVGLGLYFAVVTATTVGYGDITPHGFLAHLLAVGMMLTVVPLFTSCFSLLTSWLTKQHIDRRHDELKQHVDLRHEELKERLGGDS